MRWTTTDPRSAGLADRTGAVINYVTGGVIKTLVKVSTGATDWAEVTAVLPAAPMDSSRCPTTSTDPRTAGGRAAALDDIVMYYTGGVGTYLIKYGTGNTDWVPLPDLTGSTGGVPTTRTLTGTTPIRIDGGASGNLSADRTISVLDNSTSAKGVVAIAPNDRSKVWLGDATWGRLSGWVWMFGSAVDGDAHFDGAATVTLNGTSFAPSGNTYTITRDLSCGTMTIDNGVTVFVHGVRIFCKTALVLNGTLSVKGNDGGNGSGVAGSAGAAIAARTFLGVSIGVAGDSATPSTSSTSAPLGFTVGSTTATSNDSAGNNGAVGNGGTGGAGGKNSGGAAVPGGVTTGTITLMTTANGGPVLDAPPALYSGKGVITNTLFTWGTAGSAGKAGGGSSVGHGGGSGTAGGACYVAALTISGSGSIDARGGNGGNGGAASGGFGGGGGGGAGGGAGGVVLLVQGYGTLPTITITGGSGGSGGAGDTTGTPGKTGGNGGDGLKFTYLLVP